MSSCSLPKSCCCCKPRSPLSADAGRFLDRPRDVVDFDDDDPVPVVASTASRRQPRPSASTPPGPWGRGWWTRGLGVGVEVGATERGMRERGCRPSWAGPGGRPGWPRRRGAARCQPAWRLINTANEIWQESDDEFFLRKCW